MHLQKCLIIPVGWGVFVLFFGVPCGLSYNALWGIITENVAFFKFTCLFYLILSHFIAIFTNKSVKIKKMLTFLYCDDILCIAFINFNKES